MSLDGLTPMLETSDVSATVKYYQGILGFEIVETLGEGRSMHWACVRHGPVVLMFISRDKRSDQPHPVLTGSLYIYTDDVEALWRELKPKAKIESPLTTSNYGMREFGLRDNNGYLLRFGQNASDL